MRVDLVLYPEKLEAAIKEAYEAAVKHGVKTMKSLAPQGRTGNLKRGIKARSEKRQPHVFRKVAVVTKGSQHLRYGYVHNAGHMTRNGNLISLSNAGFLNQGQESFQDAFFQESRKRLK